MKVISLIEPWATLWLLGVKRYETRGWRTWHRGPLLVHASTKVDADGGELWQGLQALGRLPFPWNEVVFENLRRGQIVGRLSLTGCVGMDGLAVTEGEAELGNFGPRRFAWDAEGRVLFETGIPLRGWPGLFDYKGALPA